MGKQIYKLVDEKGRVLLPMQLRQKAELEKGDIVKLSFSAGKITVSKVDLVEAGRQDPEAVEAYVHAAVKTMSPDRQVALASKLLKLIEQEREEKQEDT